MNKDSLLLRSAVIKSIRKFFDDRGYTEMHTPRMVGLPGQEPYLEPFWTEVSSPAVSCAAASCTHHLPRIRHEAPPRQWHG